VQILAQADLAENSLPASASLPSLAEVLAYRNPEVVLRFAQDYKVSQADAEDLFQETLRWLWLSAYQITKHENGENRVSIPLLSEVFAVDLMWHTFILFTQDYAQFCNRYFHFFVHHTPQTQAEKNKWLTKMEQDPEGTQKEREKILRDAYEAIYDILGEDILIKWMEEYPQKFKSLR